MSTRHSDGPTHFLVALPDSRTYTLRVGSNTIGRGPGNDIEIRDNSVSRRHCVVVIEADGSGEVVDTGSRNGVLVNNASWRLCWLVPGDVLRICHHQFLYTRTTPHTHPPLPVLDDTDEVGRFALILDPSGQPVYPPLPERGTVGVSAVDSWPAHPSFDDAVLGRVRWIPQDGCWSFYAGPVDGRPVPAYYVPDACRRPPAEHGWDGVRAGVRWLRSNERVIRTFVFERTEVDVRRDVRIMPRLRRVLFFKDQCARVMYAFLGHEVWVHLDVTGRIVAGPFRFASAQDDD